MGHLKISDDLIDKVVDTVCSNLCDEKDKKLIRSVTSFGGKVIKSVDRFINKDEYEIDRIRKILFNLSTLHENEKYNELNDYCDTLIIQEDNECLLHNAYYYKSLALVNIANDINFDNDNLSDNKKQELQNDCQVLEQEAVNCIDKAISYCENKDDDLYWSYLHKGWLHTGRFYYSNEIARKYFILAMSSDNVEIVQNANNGYELATERLFNLFNYHQNGIFNDIDELNAMSDISDEDKSEIVEMMKVNAEDWKFCNRYLFSERQFIFITKKIAGCYDNNDIINWVFTPDRIPADLSFPSGHPQLNSLYIAHPVKKGVYLPFDGAEDTLFHEKVDDFCRLAQCLGATEISFNSLCGIAVSQETLSSIGLSGSFGVKGQNLQGVYSRQEKSNLQEDSKTSVGYSYTLNPKVKPYCPDDVAWLNVDKSWVGFVKQRLEGDMLTYTKRISSLEAINMSSQLSNSIKASFSNLMVNVDGNYDSSTDRSFCNVVNSEWEIIVQFKSIYDFEDSSVEIPVRESVVEITANLSDEEIAYRDEVLFMLEDGEIGYCERKLLDRKRVKFGLSKERAVEIELMCRPQLSSEEIEYIEIYKELAEDGEITERKRKMLNREAETLGISQERASKLERL